MGVGWLQDGLQSPKSGGGKSYLPGRYQDFEKMMLRATGLSHGMLFLLTPPFADPPPSTRLKVSTPEGAAYLSLDGSRDWVLRLSHLSPHGFFFSVSQQPKWGRGSVNCLIFIERGNNSQQNFSLTPTSEIKIHAGLHLGPLNHIEDQVSTIALQEWNAEYAELFLGLPLDEGLGVKIHQHKARGESNMMRQSRPTRGSVKRQRALVRKSRWHPA